MEPRTRQLGRLLLGAALITAVLATSACFGSSNPQDTLSPRGPVAHDQKQLFYPIFWIAVAVFVLVEGLLVYALVRFRHRPGYEGLPKQVHGNTRVEIGWTIAPTLLLAIITVPTVATIYRLAPKEIDNPLHVTVVGHQWWWEFQYTDAEVGVVTANELHIPLHRRVNLKLNSIDVIHAFFVPELAGQVDVVPGHNNEMWIQADHAGTFSGQCNQFCGTSHAFMRFKVMGDSDFDSWVQQQKAPPTPPQGDTQAGATAFANGACIGCHTIQGVSQGKVGPNLTHFGSRTSLAGASLDNNSTDVAKWIRNPQAVKPEAKMPNLHLDEQTIADLVTYLESLK